MILYPYKKFVFFTKNYYRNKTCIKNKKYEGNAQTFLLFFGQQTLKSVLSSLA